MTGNHPRRAARAPLEGAVPTDRRSRIRGTPGDRRAPGRVPGSLLVLALFSGTALAGDVSAGRAKASACAVCHGANGLSVQPNAPHLAGQPEIYLAEQLKNYRSGKRPHEVMSVIAKPLTDTEIEDLAAWYASLQLSVQTP